MSANEGAKWLDAFYKNFAGGDVEALKALFTEDAVIWHNNDEKEATVSDFGNVASYLVNALSERSFVEPKLKTFDNGFVQQHVISGRNAAGAAVRIPCAWIVQLRDGRASRLDEYFDTAQLAQLQG